MLDPGLERHQCLDTSTWMKQLGCHAAAKRSPGVTPDVNRRNLLHTDNEAGKQGDPPWLGNPGQTSSEVQNRDISGLHKFVKKPKKFNMVFV